jgi:hypothetical protein
MARMKLNPMDLTVDTFQTAAGAPRTPAAAPNESAAVGTAIAVATIYLAADTVDQICFCMTWVAEDCFGPTAGCSTSDGTAV